MTSNEIRRLINNQKAEHVSHAFRAGGAAMSDFNRLYPVLRTMPRAKCAFWLRLIDKMRVGHEACPACSAKILAYCVLYTQGRLPELCEKNKRLYCKLVRDPKRPPVRDYMAEVIASLHLGSESPAAERHRRTWKWLAMKLALENDADRD